MTMEFIFSVVTAGVTAILGVFFKDTVIPRRFIPLQNIVIGIIAAIISVYFNLFDNVATAILVSLGMSLGVGGAYDAVRIPSKTKEANKNDR